MGNNFYHIEFEGAPAGDLPIYTRHKMSLWAHNEADAVLKLYEFYNVEQIFSIERTGD